MSLFENEDYRLSVAVRLTFTLPSLETSMFIVRQSLDSGGISSADGLGIGRPASYI